MLTSERSQGPLYALRLSAVVGVFVTKSFQSVEPGKLSERLSLSALP